MLSGSSAPPIQALVQAVAGNVGVAHRGVIGVVGENIQKQVHGIGDNAVYVKGQCGRIDRLQLE